MGAHSILGAHTSAQEEAGVLYSQTERLDALERTYNKSKESLAAAKAQLAANGIIISGTGSQECGLMQPQEMEPLPLWSECVTEAQAICGTGHTLDDLFTPAGLAEIEQDVRILNDEYRQIHRLDEVDVVIGVCAGMLSAAVDLILVGVPQRTPDGLRAQPLENYVRDWFKRVCPEEEMAKLTGNAAAKVPYDAPYNLNFTETYVEGLWPAMHRLYSLGHDPLLGFVVGVHDILNGQMTTIDKLGNVAVQDMPRYAGREEATLFAALCKQFIHMKTDVNTSMGLPVPLMGLFNLMQFGSIGEAEQTVAEIVQGMYYEGYDFEHFCAQSIPVMLTEVIVRLSYFIKRVKEGRSVAESVPLTCNRDKRPKLGTMLFVAHSMAAALNAGKVAFARNPMEISYPQWIAFSIYAFKQAGWVLVTKSRKQYEYVMDALESDIAAYALPQGDKPILIGEF